MTLFLGVLGLSLLLGAAANANPEGGTVISGSATIVQEPGQTLIQQHSDRAIINWQGFSIGANELTRFQQPSAAAIALNRVTGGQVSNILGRLEANGQVYLINPNGIVFGPNAVVDLAGLIASTHDIRDPDFLAGQLDFTIPGQANARILNQGLITAAEGGLVALVAPSVANSGVIQARLGQVVIAGTNAATIDPYGDDLIVFRADSQVVAALTDPDSNPLAALIDISGEITADGGRVLITANMARGVVNSAIDMTGIVQARSIEMQNGEIVLNGGDGITNIAGTLDATGTGPGETGGAIEVASDVIMHSGTLDASGGSGGTVAVAGRVVFNQGRILADGTTGTGGEIFIQSARNYLDVASSVTSATGVTGGGDIGIDGGPEGSVYSSGQTSVASSGGAGGSLDLLGRNINLIAARLDASGATGGGTIRVGGDFQGGGDLPHAETVYVSSATTIAANATENGDGGTVILWSDRETLVGGSLSARGGAAGGDGGLIEISSADAAAFAGTADAAAPQGQAGELLLDPKNITIDDATGLFPQFDLVDPLAGAGNTFGSSIDALSTGNVVVADSGNDSVATDAGAVHLFDAQTGALISTLTGSTGGDLVGKGIVTLTNGNFVVRSPDWDNGATGGAGAATWVSGTTGLAGSVSTANSLYGTTVGDQIGQFQIQALTNGNYVVLTSNWDNGAIVNAGAVTWGNGTAGTSGAVSTANSLYGTTASDFVGNAGIVALTNGNYVVQSPAWDDGAVSGGAVTWGNGTIGITGAVSTANSLYGTTNGDGIGTTVVALTNGNYVAGSWSWSNGGIVNAGVATWGSGTTGTTGAVSTANSLYGTTANDRITVSGSVGGVIALSNGNYVVRTTGWDNGGIVDAGAAIWGNGTTGITGAVSTANSLYGTTASDNVGEGVTALTNGNYVVSSKNWDNGGAFNAGAATWGDGSIGITGAVSTANSLYGTTSSDIVSSSGVAALTNGNYVVQSQSWDNGGTADVGATTWGDGTTGITGAVSTANSLYGTTPTDYAGNNVTALTNGNYVVENSNWHNGGIVNAGAATWGDGTTGITGVISTTNSLYGTTASDFIGGSDIIALSNGNYVVQSGSWDNGGIVDVGAATWGNGTTGITGAVSTTNSLHGATSANRIGNSGITALANGNYVVQSNSWDNGGITNAGAATFVNGSTGQTLSGSNVVSAQNSIIGLGASAGLASITEDSINNSFLVRFTASPGRVVTGLTDLSQITFSRGSLSGMVLPSAILTYTLNAGTVVTLQASNDITVNSAIIVNNGAGDGGALTLQAGRSILVNADIFTDNGNLSLFANDLLANGVIDAQRDAGAAVIAMAAGTTLDAGTGAIVIELHDGTGKTNTASGDITLGNVTGATVTVKNDGLTASSDILMASGAEAISANTLTVSTGSGNDITLNNAGNDFASVAITSARNVVLAVTNALDFLASTISGIFSVTAGGAITDSGVVIVAGATTLATGTGISISFDSIGNDFTSVAITSAKDVTLVDVNAITLATSTVSGILDVKAGGAVSGGSVTVQSLKIAGTSVALTGSIAGAADQAAANSIILTSLGGGPYTFNGYTIGATATTTPATDAALEQQAAQIGSAGEETTTTTDTVIAELTGESTTTELIVTEPLDSGGTTDTNTETTASEQTIAVVEEVMATDSLVEAVEYINGEGDVSLADQQEFFQTLDGTEIVDSLLSSDDSTAQSIGEVFEEIAGGAEISQSEMKSQLQEMGLSGGRMLSYLGLFARVQKHARTEMLENALESLMANPEAADVEVVAPVERQRPSAGAGRKIALLIGIDAYSEPLPSLNTPIGDVAAVGALLERKLGYETRILENATKAEMVEALQALVDEVTEADSVVVFYAGHGYILEANGIGYWLPSDATADSADNWISNTNVSEFLNAMRAKNIMLIADSCYSGSLLTGEQKVAGVQVRLNREQLKDKRSVVILSSGGEEPVQDAGGDGHSVFARQLMTVLEGMDGDSVGVELYEEVKIRLAELAPQVPQYGGIISAGHEAGADHLFELGS